MRLFSRKCDSDAADIPHRQTLLSYGHQIALHTDDYDKAERLLDQVLRFQPSNNEALQVLDVDASTPPTRNLHATSPQRLSSPPSDGGLLFVFRNPN